MPARLSGGSRQGARARRGCVSIGLENQQRSAVSLDGKPLPACPATAIPEPLYQGGYGADKPVTLEAGGVRYTLDAQASGTHFLTLSARSGERVLWQNNLRHVKSQGGLRMVLTPTEVVVYGSDPGDDDYGFIVGIEPGTGAQRYPVRQDSHLSGRIWSFEFNRRYVIAAWGFGLHAYDPKNGERVWHIGGR